MAAVQTEPGARRISPSASSRSGQPWSREDARESPGDISPVVPRPQGCPGAAEATGFHGGVGKRNLEGELGNAAGSETAGGAQTPLRCHCKRDHRQ